MSSADARPEPEFQAVKANSCTLQPNPNPTTCNLQITPSVAEDIKEFPFVDIPD